MTAVWVILALGGPWLAGAAVLRTAGWGRPAATALGWFLGMALMMAVGSAWALSGAEVNGRILAIGSAVVGTGLWWLVRRRAGAGAPASTALSAAEVEGPWTAAQHLLVLVLLISILVKTAALIAADVWIPTRGEDAMVYWLFKAKVLTEWGRLPLDPADPFFLGGPNPRYPLYPCLIAAWLPLAAGRWSESLAALPWVVTYVCLPAAVYFGLGGTVGRTARLAAAYVTATLPLLVTHVYRPGYVDVLLAAFLMVGVLALLDFWRTGRWAAWGTALVLLLAAACTKREGPIPAGLTLAILGIPAALKRSGASSKCKGAALGSAAAWVVAVAALVDFRDARSDAAAGRFHAEALPALFRHAFEWSSFHFLFAAMIVALTALWVIRPRGTWRSTTIYCLALPAYVAAIFTLTDNVRFALNDQTPSRCLLQIAPAMIVALTAALGRREGITAT